MAVAMDLGDPLSPFGSIHPRDKMDVGNRLALGGLALGYGKDKYYTGPLVSTIRKGGAALEITFRSLNGYIELRNANGFEVFYTTLVIQLFQS